MRDVLVLIGKAALATAAMCALSGAAYAQTPPLVFDGAGFVTDAEGCPPQDGFAAPFPVTFVFRPAFSIPGAPEALEINIIGKAAALITSTSSTGKLAGSSTFDTTGISYWATAYSNGSKPGASKLTFSPKTITAETRFVTISGTIKNLTGATTCVLTLSGALTQRP